MIRKQSLQRPSMLAIGISIQLIFMMQVPYHHVKFSLSNSAFQQNLEPIGEAVEKAIADGKVSRKDLFVVTKVWPTWYGPDRVEASVRRNLRESGLDYFDLVLLHWPTVFADSDTEKFPMEPGTDNVIFAKRNIVDVYRDLENVQRKGLTRSIGVSNFNAEQVERLMKSPVSIVPVTNQVECHLYLAQFDLQNVCAKHGIILTAYCPLSRNRPGEQSVLNDKTVESIAAKYDRTTAQIAIRWLIQRGIIAIPKTVNPERLKINFTVFDFEISDDDCKILDSLDQGEKGRRVWFDMRNNLREHPEYPFK